MINQMLDYLVKIYRLLEARAPIKASKGRGLVSKLFPSLALRAGSIYRAQVSTLPKSLHISAGSEAELDSIYENLAVEYKNEAVRAFSQAAMVVVGVLPPNTSSIAKYNYQVFGKIEKCFFISPTVSLQNANLLTKFSKAFFCPLTEDDIEKFSGAQKFGILTLGNSPEHLKSIPLFSSMIERAVVKDYSLELHDVDIDWIMRLLMGEATVSILNSTFFEQNENVQTDHTKGLLGLPTLFEVLGQPKSIIVHTSLGREMIFGVLKIMGLDIPVHVVEIPHIDSILAFEKAIAKTKKPNEIITFGTFGYPAKHKELELTYGFLCEARKLGKTFEWVVAGRNVDEYFASNGMFGDWIRFYNKPTDSELIELMASVDFGLQFRFSPMGEASGICTQLEMLCIPYAYSSCTSWSSFNQLSMPILSESHLFESMKEIFELASTSFNNPVRRLEKEKMRSPDMTAEAIVEAVNE